MINIIKGACDFIKERSSAEVTTVASLMVVNLIEIKI